MPPLLVKLITTRLRQARIPFFVKPIARGIADQVDKSYTDPALDLHLGFVEKTLAERSYFAGNDFSIADIQMIYPVEAALSRGGGDRLHRLVYRLHGPEGVFARTWPTGAIAFWAVLVLCGFLLLYLSGQ